MNDEDKLHQNARKYFKYFLEQEIILKISTISIAEYCVLGKLENLPIRNIQMVPFNLNHAKRTGEFAKVIFEENKKTTEKLLPRAIIPNDSKLFAQADLDLSVTYFITSDKRSINTYNLLSKHLTPRFEIIDISVPYNQSFGILDL